MGWVYVGESVGSVVELTGVVEYILELNILAWRARLRLSWVAHLRNAGGLRLLRLPWVQ